MVLIISILTFAFLTSVIPPIVFVAIRNAVKRHRQKTVLDLASVFEINNDLQNGVITSFEFVKYKYFFKQDLGRVLGAEGYPLDDVEAVANKYDHSRVAWSFGMLPLVSLCFLITFLLLWVFVGVNFPDALNVSWLPGQKTTATPLGSEGSAYASIVAGAFVGAYLANARSLMRAVINFDLNPGTFVDATIKILTSLGGSVILIPVVTGILTNGAASGRVLYAAVLLAFVAGFLPETIIKNIIRRSRLQGYKQEDYTVYKTFKAVPPEVIDGIDTEVSDRLSDYNIRSTQNLATSNPLMLFVETPYGVYQIMDWVAQAQLCCSVGPRTVVLLWKLGVRTLFDLERAARASYAKDNTLLLAIGHVLLNEALPPRQRVSPSSEQSPQAAVEEGSAQWPPLSLATIIADIEMRLDDPHVQRLRQIFLAVGNRLGADSRRFVVLPQCTPEAAPACPFRQAA